MYIIYRNIWSKNLSTIYNIKNYMCHVKIITIIIIIIIIIMAQAFFKVYIRWTCAHFRDLFTFFFLQVFNWKGNFRVGTDNELAFSFAAVYLQQTAAFRPLPQTPLLGGHWGNKCACPPQQYTNL